MVLLPICFVDISALARVQVLLNVLGYFCISTMVLSVGVCWGGWGGPCGRRPAAWLLVGTVGERVSGPVLC